jgi:hypothetical protein
MSLSFVREDRKQKSKSNKGQAVPKKHTIDEQGRSECEPNQGIIDHKMFIKRLPMPFPKGCSLCHT